MKKRAKIFFPGCEHSSPFKAGCERRPTFGKKQKQRAWVGVFISFPKRVVLSWIGVAAILVLLYPGAQLNTPHHSAQNFTFTPWPPTHLRGSLANWSVPVCSSDIRVAAPRLPTAVVLPWWGAEPSAAPPRPHALSCASGFGLFQELSPGPASQPRLTLKVWVNLPAVPELLQWVDVHERLVDMATWASSCYN